MREISEIVADIEAELNGDADEGKLNALNDEFHAPRPAPIELTNEELAPIWQEFEEAEAKGIVYNLGEKLEEALQIKISNINSNEEIENGTSN